MGRFDNERLALEAATGGKNTLIIDDVGMPSVMVKIPRFRMVDVIDGAPTTPHPAFIVNGKVLDCIYISKYQNIVEGGRAYSLAGRDPATYMDCDQAHQYCKAKGAGWHLMSNAEWAAIALWCKKNGTIPGGNNYCGCDMDHKWEKGVEAMEWLYTADWNGMSKSFDGTNYHLTGRVLTGSGPASWAHDGTSAGIYDLNGNVWEWVSGLRTKNGEIQVTPDNNSALGLDESDASAVWRALLQNGTYVIPGISDTLKFNSSGAGNNTQVSNRTGSPVLDIKRDKPSYTGGEVNDYFGYADGTFEAFAAAAGVTVPILAKALGLYPLDADCGGDYLHVRNYGERLAIRGGRWDRAGIAGVFGLALIDHRSYLGSSIGFRAAFVDL